MTWWKLATLIIFFGFRRRYVLDLKNISEVDWVVVGTLSFKTPLRTAVIKIFQDRGISWRKLSTLIICVGFRSHDGSYLEGLVLDVDLVISESPSSSISFYEE